MGRVFEAHQCLVNRSVGLEDSAHPTRKRQPSHAPSFSWAIAAERRSVAFPLSRAPHESKPGSRRINGTVPATFIDRIAQCATTDEV